MSAISLFLHLYFHFYLILPLLITLNDTPKLLLSLPSVDASLILSIFLHFLEFSPLFGDHTVHSGKILTLQILTLFCLITSGTLSTYVNMGFMLPDCFFSIFKIYQPEITSYCLEKKKNLKSTIRQGL